MWCLQHRDENTMINVAASRCECGTHAKYGYLGSQPETCSQCRKRNMVIFPRKRCEECRQDFAFFGPSVSKRIHCGLCRIESDRQFVDQRCITCGEVDVVSNEGVCCTCDPVNFYLHNKAKELEVKAWLDANGIHNYIWDRRLDGGECTDRRPDFIFDCGTHKLILEVDEDQHESYNPECELTRMMDLAQSNGIQTIFIRYNPDEYRVNGSRMNDTTLRRRQTLLDWVKFLKNPIEGGKALNFCTAYYLFYDGYMASDVKAVCITPWEDDDEEEQEQAKKKQRI